jgi:hypothetical protein
MKNINLHNLTATHFYGLVKIAALLFARIAVARSWVMKK